MEEEFAPKEKSTLLKMAKMFGSGMSDSRRDEIYFGKAPRNAYFGFNKDIAHIHDIRMSPDQKARLYGIGGKQIEDAGDLAGMRLETDSRADLVRELAEETQLTRSEAEALVDRWMLHNDLVEVDDPDLGKIIVPRR